MDARHLILIGPSANAMSEEKPQVFVSSTVHDFRDLRSALKLWLEEFGFEVLVSEFNDFPQEPDCSTYESCLRAIDRSDYYLLFIGARVGGWYNRDQQISVTRMEYQYARNRSLESGLKIVVFVRKEIWVIREDREALREYLEEDSSLARELSIDQKKKLVSFPSRFANDAEFIASFLSEVTHTDEASRGSPSVESAASGDWVYQFLSFRDIIESLRTVLDLSGNLRLKALGANLKHEIEKVIANLLERHDHQIKPITEWSMLARRSFKGGWDDNSRYRGDHLIRLSVFIITSVVFRNQPRMTSLHEAIVSGEFLEFNQDSKTISVGPLQRSLLELQAQMERIQLLLELDELRIENALPSIESLKSRRHDIVTVPNSKLTLVFAVHDAAENTLQLCRAIHAALDGNQKPLREIKLHPSSPLEAEAERIQREAVSNDEVREWLASSQDLPEP